MMEQIRLIDQIKEMARRAYVRNTGRAGHHFPAGSESAHVFEAEYDRCEVAHAMLAYLKPTMLRQRPTGSAQP